VCLDGSPPAYHFDEGHDEGANNWIVHIEVPFIKPWRVFIIYFL